MNTEDSVKNPFETLYTDLASRKLGGQAIACSNDFFAEMENLLKLEEPVFQKGVFTERGQLMDGWESRRRRFLPDGTTDDGLEYDWCVIKLGAQGIIRGVNVDTAHFLGNAPQSVSLEACVSEGNPDDNTEWSEIVVRSEVGPGAPHYFSVESEQVWTHVRLNMYPDGGIARLKVYGEVIPDADLFLPGELIDLAYIKNGARPVVCSDMFFSHMENMIMPGRGVNMGDGWETKRRRTIGDAEKDRFNDWLILKLAAKGSIEKVLVDTAHFKGNYPHSFAIEAAVLTDEQAADVAALEADSHQDALMVGRAQPSAINWQPIMDRTRLYDDREHTFKKEVQNNDQAFTHVRVKMYPDGGISRVRLWGYPSESLAKVTGK